MSSDFVVVVRVRARFGADADPGGFGDQEDTAPFVGLLKTWEFDCHGVDARQDAVLVFQVLGVLSNTNRIRVNSTPISGGVPAGGFAILPTQGPGGIGGSELGVWAGQCLIVPPRTLLEASNRLEIESTGENFVIDNVVLFYRLSRDERGDVARR
jgi:hypothetical protein